MKQIVVGILAHVDSGKTTLTEAMLYRSGDIRKRGRVDHKDSFLDTYSLERDRGITIFSKQALMHIGDGCYTLLDTPGHADFSAETERTLSVLDYAILVISGTDGVQSHTRTLWQLLKKYRIPCFVFVNKMDLEGAHRLTVMASLSGMLGDGFVDFSAPADEINENAAVCSDELFSEYSEYETIRRESLVRAVSRRELFPVLFGSALKLDGVDELLKLLDEFTVMKDYPEEFSARVFKIAEDKQKNRLTFMKITGGMLHVRDVLESDKNKSQEKAASIRLYSGEKFVTVDSAAAGQVCAVTGISFAGPGDGIGCEKNKTAALLQPVLRYSVILPPDINVHTAFEKLKKLESEDPQLSLEYNEKTASVGIRIMGEIQLEILKSVINDRFGFDVDFDSGSIIYKETITKTVEGIGHFEPLRHYAEVHVILKPGKPGSGIVFGTNCREELLDRTRQHQIMSALQSKTHVGVLTGSAITDMEIILVSGKDHPKHTEGGDLRQAALRAVRQGLRNAGSVLLEPYYEFTLSVPSESTGRSIADIQHMSGSFSAPETQGDMTVIRGIAPASEISTYSSELIRYTSGRGSLSMSFSGYKPCHNAEEIIEKTAYDPDRDTENPCDSVFCSHGAGYIVKWDDVKSHMHLSAFLEEKEETKSRPVQKNRGSVLAADRELQEIFENTYGPIKQRSAPQKKEISFEPPAAKPAKAAQKRYNGKEYVLVDGYNVIFAWDELRSIAKDSIDLARSRLINILCNYRGYRKCELILVFDAYRVKGSDREVEKTGGISIIYTKEAETADMYIEKITHELARDNRVRVVTSDGTEQIIILGGGALRVSSAAFRQEVEAAQREIRELAGINNDKG